MSRGVYVVTMVPIDELCLNKPNVKIDNKQDTKIFFHYAAV